jgi:gallate dioxygenase
MAKIVGGIGASHTPTIGFAKDNGKQDDPAWKPIFEGFDAIRNWIKEKEVDVIFLIYNDHITSFFFDHYSPLTLGIDEKYEAADEGGGARKVAPALGHLGLSQHIGMSLVSDDFDLSFFQGKPVDHGCLSPLSMLSDETTPWQGKIVPLQVGVLQVPMPSPRRLWNFGKALRRAIESYPENLNVAIMSTGGLSHQVHGERAGFLNESWDLEFLELLEKEPEKLVEMRLSEFATRGGMEGAEVIMWLIMRGALTENVKLLHKQTYAPSVTNIATLIFEDQGLEPDPSAVQAQLKKISFQWEGIEDLKGTYPFTLSRSQKNLRINSFLHKLVIPTHRARFLNDFEALAQEFQLTQEEKELIQNRKWIEMIRRGVIFFVLEKMAAVLGISNPEVYAAFRGETIDQFLATRKVPIRYSVSGENR